MWDPSCPTVLTYPVVQGDFWESETILAYLMGSYAIPGFKERPCLKELTSESA